MWSALPNWIIAFATIIYAGVTIVMYKQIKSQVKATRRQAEIAEKAANAAMQSAEAAKRNIELLVERERARLIVSFKPAASYKADERIFSFDTLSPPPGGGTLGDD